jgi:hypothetical protein
VRGRLRVITGTNPAAGVEISETVPAGKRWLLKSVMFQLVTGVGGGGSVSLVIDDGTTVGWREGTTVTQGASITMFYVFADGTTRGQSVASGAGNLNVGPLPRAIELAAGWRFRTQLDGLNANDDYGAPTYIVEEWDV